MSLNLKKVLPLFIAIIPLCANALPIDWHGSFGVDSTMITDYRKINSKANVTNSASGSQETTLAAGNKSDASFQSYIFRLAPDIIVNDTATIRLEFTTGYASGGFLGDSPSNAKVASTSGNVQTYYNNQASGQSLNLKKAYVELNADTATWLIGRHTVETWALGGMFSDGKDSEQKDSWNRFAYSRDGVTAKFKFNNFFVTPFWTQSSNTGLTRSTDAKEFGSSFLYDNRDKEIAFGLYYSKKSNNAFNTYYTSSVGAANVSLGSTNVKVTDIYLKKKLDKFSFGVEVPLVTGELGHVFDATSTSTISSKAILLQANYQHNDSWLFGIDAGDVSGNDGNSSKFSASYLNPNFHIANLLFKYNVAAIGSGSDESIFDGNISNTQYLKVRATYSSEKWILDFGYIHAKAKEVAKAGVQSYNHTKNKYFTAITSQADDLGSEIDFNMKYKWNKEISIGSALGYLMAGNYFSYTNTATPNTPKDSLLVQINTFISF